MERAIFAAGCFWGVQYYFDQVLGVTKSSVGYTGGHTEEPSYEQVCTHTTGHAEAVELEFDVDQVSFAELCQHFFRMHDPTQLNRQGPDHGDSYRTGIFYTSAEQNTTAEQELKKAQANFDQPIVTEITEASTFWPAEDYHQKYAENTGRGTCHIPYSPLAA